MISLRTDAPTVGEYKRLAQAVGWENRTDSFVRVALANSRHVICAHDRAEIVGLARIVGDGKTFFYLQDIMVLPAYQKQGIGHALMTGLMDWLAAHAAAGTTAHLRPAAGTEGFYARFGFANIDPDESDMSYVIGTAPA